MESNETSRQHASWGRRCGVALALLVVLSFALWLRWQRAAAGLPYIHDWDEPTITSTALDMVKTGRAAPGFYHYGSLTYYALAAVDILALFHLAGSEPPHLPLVRDGVYEYSRFDIDALQTVYDTGWQWQISHPDILLFDRRFFALLGCAMIALTFALGRRSSAAGAKAGLLAAAVLAVTEIHLERSTVVNADLPMALCALASVVLALRWFERSWSNRSAADPKNADFILSLVAAGLAASCKYNGILVVLVPAAALALVSARSWLGLDVSPVRARHWLWLAVPTVPVAAFLAGTPYALLDLPTFLADATFEVYHYTAGGHAAYDVPTGWPHLRLSLGRIADNLGWLPAGLALLGAARFVRSARGLLLVSFPVVYLLYMASTIPTFHRNLLVLYPFLALCAAEGAFGLGRWIVSKLPQSTRRFAPWAAVLTAALWVGTFTVDAIRVGTRLTEPETRTLAVDHLLELAADAAEAAESGDTLRVGIAEELRIHPLDLARLDGVAGLEVEVVPHLDLVCGAESANERDVLLTGGTYATLWVKLHPEAFALSNRLAKASPVGVARSEIQKPDQLTSPTRIDGLSDDPWIVVWRPDGPFEPPPACAVPSADGAEEDGDAELVSAGE